MIGENEPALAKWIEQRTQHVDLVASWETLLAIYRQLGFTDPLTDAERLEEFSIIIRENNKFLTKMRKVLGTARNVRAAIDLMDSAYLPGKGSIVTTRTQITFQKLKQQWIANGINELRERYDIHDEEEEEDAEW